jgi:hypothetical protein
MMNLVFASGFLVAQRFLTNGYFRGLEAHLEGKHATQFPEVPPLASSEERTSSARGRNPATDWPLRDASRR